ncbi:cardiolipin synthase [Sphingomonas ginkgonis]|uniref:Cardiolipin synthase n=1 Tax=Sphingomonas ginkgonis TaxID=2315330 RepID=A0A3R9WN55_9SPHN|nr:cardiolipin synthase [Sphingomonas ginkgonis]RST30349.1 cardiolipin synthase [Sphingomonas ginkgonis]
MPTHYLWLTLLVLAEGAVIVRAVLLDGRDPYSRAAWVMTIILLPILGVLLYATFGEPWMSQRFRRRAAKVSRHLQSLTVGPRLQQPIEALPGHFLPPFRQAEAIADIDARAGNRFSLAPDSDSAVDMLVADIDSARRTVHLSVYIWLTDRNGVKLIEAVIRAAKRGVRCRIAADALGSRQLIRSLHWDAMRDAGVDICPSLSLPKGFNLITARRLDLRNHRKVAVIDSRVTYCGSQNFADPEFRIKAKFAPWVDMMVRLEGPLALQNELIFASAWTVETGEDLSELLTSTSADPVEGGETTGVAFATGPLSPRECMSGAFCSLLYAAEHEVVVTTPYFVPDQPLLAALVNCARRGVSVVLVLPERNDSAPIGAIAKSLYPQLLRAGVRIFEFKPGLLHAKTMVADSEVVLIGSANMDRRSLELNFENNMLLHSPRLAEAVRERQEHYLSQSEEVSQDEVRQRSILRRFVENLLTMAGALF